MRTFAALALVMGSGCARIFGLDTGTVVDADARGVDAALGDGPCALSATEDIDGDCIRDDVDPCISPASDGMADPDHDGIQDAIDTCIFDPQGTFADADADGIDDACDPTSTPDEIVCRMGFTSSTVNGLVWQTPPGFSAWGPGIGELTGMPGANTENLTRSAYNLESATGTTFYDAQFLVEPSAGAATFTMYLRVNENRSMFHGCQVGIEANGTTKLAYVGTHPVMPVGMLMLHSPLPATFGLRIRGRITTSGGNATILCEATTDTNDSKSDGTLTIGNTEPAITGNVGFEVTGAQWVTHLVGIEVFHHQ